VEDDMPSHRLRSWLLPIVVCTLAIPAGAAPFERREDGIVVPVGNRLLKLQVCGERVFRVLYAESPGFFDRDTLMTEGQPCRPTPWKLKAGFDSVTLTTSRLGARVALGSGVITFLDAAGQVLLQEKAEDGKTLTPTEVQGEKTFHVRAQFEPNQGEAFYGLGQHQNALMDYKGHDVDLYQHNFVVALPFLVSSRGYGILWDNTSHTRFGDLREPALIPASQLFDKEGRPGGLTGTYRQGDCSAPVLATRVDPALDFGAPEDRPPVSSIHQAPQTSLPQLHPSLKPGEACVIWEGTVLSQAAGEYQIVAFDNNDLRLWFDGQQLVNGWRQAWLPWKDVTRVRLEEKKRYPIRVEWRLNQGEGTLRLKWKTPPGFPDTSLWSEVGDGVDYYFIHGPDLDDVVAGYREITGRAPLMPLWAYGLWQCRERYRTAQESLDVLAELRRRQIPVDNIVQDWLYWRDDQWGSHEFDPARFPDPAGWIKEIHERYHARLMISVWPKFYQGTRHFDEMNARGLLFPETLRRPTTDWLGHVHTFYDAFNPEARQLFWEQMDRELFSKGVDAWWMDATEPELVGEGTAAALKASMHPTALGSGARMANAFALVNSQAVYEGQRRADPERRVFILTRSAFPGAQRYASATWSGDVPSDWASLRKQVSAGLNFTLSGIPYWTTDIGGFATPPRWSKRDPSPEDVEEWRELFTRWFQYATFCPLFRVHGQSPPREMWFFGDESHPAYRTQLAFDRLRYRMLPYIYSLAGRVTHQHDTMMRALVMDFRDDPAVFGIGDQFMFGPALLVNPVTVRGARAREVYLPKAAGWYDFWTGELYPGGQHLEAPTPYESLPLFVKAGSVLPFGPELQHTSEKPADPITVWVYEGADAAFEIYEDEGVDYGYEKGAFATIPLRFDQRRRALTIGARQGSFEGMLRERIFRVVFVSGGRPIGHAAEPGSYQNVRYVGEEVLVRAPSSP
jgi:alpha-D-xyloside xylohydrolase